MGPDVDARPAQQDAPPFRGRQREADSQRILDLGLDGGRGAGRGEGRGEGKGKGGSMHACIHLHQPLPPPPEREASARWIPACRG